ncbi:MAG TPA: carboxypeptidase-like regulatory domain-containing protein, partial [Bacteroidales bacterium]|nr:carboxypeptidase-like regulatory domain-containing protein [Bacteroidales bacterium]
MLKVRSNRFVVLSILLFLGLFVSGSLHAQHANVRLSHVSIDSLVNFVRSIHPKTYFISDGLDQANYTVEAPREKILEKILSVLKEKGYAVTYFDEGIYILRTVGFATELPMGYFSTGEAVQRDTSIYLDQSGYKFTFANKVYEIGESNSGVTGKVYLSGYVTDVATGEPLVGISILEESTGTYAQSDASGFYRILLPVGEHLLRFSGYSLEDLDLNVLLHDRGTLDVTMKVKVFALKGAVITSEGMAQHRTSRMGVERVRVENIKKVPAVFGEADVIKVIMTLPGVKSVGEASGGFNVRGGANDQNLILFNDGTIYNPNHLFGVFSAFNTDIVSDVELFKSSIPAEYG